MRIFIFFEPILFKFLVTRYIISAFNTDMVISAGQFV